MRLAIARAVLALAAAILGGPRRSWALAMQVELDAAAEDGRALAFAIGCLFAAWRELPRYAEGRLALATHALAIGLIMPIAGLSIWAGLLGYPYLAFGDVGISGFIAGQSEQIPLLAIGERAVAPALTLAVLVQAAGQILLAWFVVEQDWGRVAAIGRFNAAAVSTLIIVTSALAIAQSSILLPIAALVTETLAVLALGWWHDHLPDDRVAERAPG